jgi:hypothetical protein
MKKTVHRLWIAMLALSLTLACFRDPRPRPALEFDPATLPAAQVGVRYEATITVSQNATPVYWMSVSDGALPDGLTLEYHEHDSFAKIVGIPTLAGTFNFTISAACLGTSVNGQMGQKEYTLEVK